MEYKGWWNNASTLIIYASNVSRLYYIELSQSSAPREVGLVSGTVIPASVNLIAGENTHNGGD